ncbi:hypothetical protein EDC04DRAFT_2699750 [Pisolithus marmoratus]|nr:hypothetical protein EDC04DRAFT_2699750 [Pisolithus marmoratus]
MTSTPACTPPRRSTLSIKEFSHLISESLDMSPYSSPFNLEKLEKGSSEKQKSSSFQRIFLRSSNPAGGHCSPEKNKEDMPSTPTTPRRMGFPWPFSRGSPSRRSSYYEPNGPDMSDEQKPPNPASTLLACRSTSPASASSVAAGSTSSLGSLILPNEQFSRDDSFDDSHRSLRDSTLSPIFFARPNSPARATSYVTGTPNPASHSFHGSKSHSSSIDSSGTEVVEIGIAISSEDYLRSGANVSSPSPRSDSGTSEDDPTPRASTFSTSAIVPPSPSMGDALTLTQRRRLQALSLILPAQSNETPKQETEADSDPSSCTSMVQPIPISSMRSPVPIVLTTPPSDTTPVVCCEVMGENPQSLSRPSSSQGSLNSVYSGGGCTRSAPRGTKPPPLALPGPPPSRPLPAVPSRDSSKSPVPQVVLSGPGVSVPVSAPSTLASQISLFPPVPPLPPALKSRQSMLAMQLPLPNSSSNITTVANKLQPQGQVPQAQGRAQSPSRSPSKQTQFQAQSPPGALRLPSRIFGGIAPASDGFAPSNSVAGLLPSPPASPTKGAKRMSALGSSSSIGLCTSPQSTADALTPPRTLKRPTSLGVGILEAASVAAAIGNTTMGSDSVQGNVRRTKSILLLGPRSKFAFPFGSGGNGGSGAGRGTTAGVGMQKRVQIRAESGFGQACKDGQEGEVETGGRHGHGCVGVGIGAVIGAEKESKEKEANALKMGRRRSALGLMNISLGIGRDKDKERDRDKNKEGRAKRTSDPTPTLAPPPTTPTLVPTSAPSDSVPPQLLILRERRHSAPILSRMRSRNQPRLGLSGDAAQENTNTQREPSMDWTLSLPLSTDVPGGKISPLVKAAADAAEGQGRGEIELEEEEKEDWTLCMPLRVRVEVAVAPPSIGSGREVSDDREGQAEDGDKPDDSEVDSRSDLGLEQTPDDECANDASHTSEPCVEPEEAALLSDKGFDIRDQLPTPSPSPTPSSPLVIPSPYVRVHGHGTELEHGARARTMCDSDGGLDIDSGRGKRGSGWNVFGWFGDSVSEAAEEEAEHRDEVYPKDFGSMTRRRESSYYCEPQQSPQRHLSKDSMVTVASTTTETTMYYSARSSCYSRRSPLNMDISRHI